MKGVSVQKVRIVVLAILDKVDQLLTTEPARLIGYGAAVLAVVIINILNGQGITRFGTGLTFDEAVGYAFASIAVLVTVIESIRKFVYAPQTYIEDVADEWQKGHEMAHIEEDFRAQFEGALRDIRTEQEQNIPQPEAQTKTPVVVGSAKSKTASGKLD
jgi:hypothetical protein